jgi:hypothetical protein
VAEAAEPSFTDVADREPEQETGLAGIRTTRRQTMYALVSWWQLPETRSRESLPELEPAIVPLVRESPGFVESYWTYERSNGKSVGFTLLDTPEHAHDLKNAIECHMESREHPAALLEMIRVQEIVAHVPARRGPADEGRSW